MVKTKIKKGGEKTMDQIMVPMIKPKCPVCGNTPKKHQVVELAKYNMKVHLEKHVRLGHITDKEIPKLLSQALEE